MKPNHSPKNFSKCHLLLDFSHVLQTSRIRVYKLGYRFYAVFYCFIHYVSSTFYSKLLSLINTHKNYKKHLVLLGFFFFTYFKRPGIRFRFSAIVYYFIHSFSSKFYSKSWSLIIPQNNFLKCQLLLDF